MADPLPDYMLNLKLPDKPVTHNHNQNHANHDHQSKSQQQQQQQKQRQSQQQLKKVPQQLHDQEKHQTQQQTQQQTQPQTPQQTQQQTQQQPQLPQQQSEEVQQSNTMTIPHGLVNNFVPNTITVPVLEPSVATSAPVIPDQSIGSASQPLPVKRGRGRPRKNVVVVVDKPRRSRGRPRKNPEASSLKMPVKAASSVNRRARASKKSYPILPTSLILKDVANSSLIDQDDARLRTVYKLVLEHQLHDLPEPSKKRKSIARSDHKSPKKLATETAKKAAELASESIIPTSSESSSSSSPFTESTVGTITESVVLSSLNAEPGQQPIPSTFQAINSTDSASIASELDLFLDTLTPDDIPLADEHELSLNLDLMSSPESPGQFDVVEADQLQSVHLDAQNFQTQKFHVQLLRLDPEFVKNGLVANIDLNRFLKSKEFRHNLNFDYKKFLLFPCEPFDPKNRAKVYQCPYCTYVSNNPNYVLMHSGRHRLGSSSPIIERRIIYGCAICKHKTTDSSQIQDHFLLHVPDMKIACPLNRIFPINQNYEYQCQLCKIKYLNTQTMVQHLFSRHLLYRCTFCDTLRPDYASLERHCSESHRHLVNSFKCQLCSFGCSIFGTLVDHFKFSHGVLIASTTFKCLLCHQGKVCYDHLSILMHLATHTGSKLFACSVCEYKSNSDYDMLLHFELKHPDYEKPSSCQPDPDLQEQAVSDIADLCRANRRQAAKEVRELPNENECSAAVLSILS